MAKRNQRPEKKFTLKMQQKLVVFSAIILVAFAFLMFRLVIISRDNGEEYKKQVLSQQAYDSITLPAKRGEIVDRNGSKVAVSQKVYNVVVSAKTLNADNGSKLESTLSTLYATNIDFSYTRDELRAYIAENPSSQYRIIAKKQSFDSVADIMQKINNPSEDEGFTGVWLEDTYQRQYPYNTLACDVIGFVQGDNEGAYGLEEYYNDVLVGVNGREYGYLNDDENLERTIKPAQDGRTLVTSLDMNIQSIVEKHIAAFNEEHRDEAREGDGASNIGVIIMNPSSGEVIAMASAPTFDLNNPRDTSNLKVSVELDPSEYGMIQTVNQDGEIVISEGGQNAGENLQEPESVNAETNNTESNNTGDSNTSNPNVDDINNIPQNLIQGTTPAALAGNNDDGDSAPSFNMSISSEGSEPSKPLTYAEAYDQAYEKAKMEALNSLWKNFCINSTYEPGSTMKPFTMATGLEDGVLRGTEEYVCNGVLEVGDHQIHCSNRLGHGPLTFSGALENSCNVAFMKMGSTIGKTRFMKYNQEFNFGLKTNIDLTGEALTNSLVFDLNTMTPTDLAIASFGQGFNVTMIQMAAGFCSLINGGYYYQPHLVTKTLDSAGAVVDTIEPRVIKQTISEETSNKIKELCINVITEGTGKTARPAGYLIGGKTGTAEKYPRGTGNYVVSFIGFAPAENPEIVIYTVIDEPNVDQQASARYATVLTKDILTEVLPYLNVFMTEELSDAEMAELAEKELLFSLGAQTEEPAEEDEYLEGGAEEDGVETTQPGDAITFVDEEPEDEEETPEIKYDPETGYAIDPTTGILLDPNTGMPIDKNISDLGY